MYGLFHDKRHGKTGERPEGTGHNTQNDGICEDPPESFLKQRPVDGLDAGF